MHYLIQLVAGALSTETGCAIRKIFHMGPEQRVTDCLLLCNIKFLRMVLIIWKARSQPSSEALTFRLHYITIRVTTEMLGQFFKIYLSLTMRYINTTRSFILKIFQVCGLYLQENICRYSVLIRSYSMDFRTGYGAINFSTVLFQYPYTSLISSFK